MRDVSSARESQSRTKRYACFAAMAIGFFFVLSLSGGNNDSQEVKSGQAMRPVHQINDITTTEGTKKNVGGSSSRGQDFDDNNDKEMNAAPEKLERVVKQQISMNESMLSGEMDKEVAFIKALLGDMLEASGVEFVAEETQSVADKIRERLEGDVEATIKEKTEQLLVDKKDEFEADSIINSLREGVDNICIEVKDQIKGMAAVAEKDVLEATFLTKTSKTYTAKISENKVVSIEKKSSTSKAKKSSKKSSKKESKKSSKKESKKSTKKKSSSSVKVPSADSSVDVEPEVDSSKEESSVEEEPPQVSKESSAEESSED